MLKINYRAVLVATLVWFVVGALWYSPLLFGKQWMRLSGIEPAAAAAAGMPVGKILGELLKGLVVAYVLARILTLAGVGDFTSALSLGLWLWIGFPVVILASSVMWQNVPWALAAIHAGDWLVKTCLMSGILGVWRR